MFSNIISFLEENPEGISSYVLLKKLQETEENFRTEAFESQYSLFQINFMLFHLLYRLQDYCRDNLKRHLHVHYLKIQLSEKREIFTDAVAEHDPLREYYINLDNLHGTSEKDVNDMLDSFWKKFSAFNRKKDALDILGLDESAREEEIKSRYRELVKLHHPDKGGSEIDFHRIQEAMSILKLL
ncbi:MAG TPA: DNA-J related domain-containing protein [Leptospiraceae bacterium]|nr:DNA-J related domain-containing protein [Leptospiraceae bacterium]